MRGKVDDEGRKGSRSLIGWFRNKMGRGSSETGTGLYPDDKSAGDHIHTAVKAGLSMVPYGGGPASTYFEELLSPPLKKRRDEFLKRVGEDLETLKSKVAGISDEKLEANERFVTASLEVARISQRTHQNEKLRMLRSALLNVAQGVLPEEDQEAVYLRFIDELTPSHVQLLRFLDDQHSFFRARGIELTPGASMSDASKRVFPELISNKGFFQQCEQDLEARGLAGLSDFGKLLSGELGPTRLSSEEGRGFLKFIENPLVKRPIDSGEEK